MGESCSIGDSKAAEPYHYWILPISPSGSNLYPYFETIDRVVRGLEYLKKSDLKSQEAIMMKMVSIDHVSPQPNLSSSWAEALIPVPHILSMSSLK